MSLNKFERGNTIKVEADFKMNGVLTDPSGSKAFIDVIKPDGSYLVSGATTTRDGTGEYHYYFQTDFSDPLGIYIVQWYGYHNLGANYGYKRLVQRDAIQIVSTEQ